jgi:hypothetical protein
VSDPRNESPQERVDYYVERQAMQRREAGQEVDVEALRRGTAALLNAAENEKAPTVSRRAEKPRHEVLEAKRQQSGEALAQKSGTEFFYRDERREKLIERPAPSAKPPSGLDGEKHFALLRRIKILMAKVPGHVRKEGESLFASFQYPRFAQLLEMHRHNAALDNPGPVGSGQYFGLSRDDRQRKFYNSLERICDLSNAVIRPPWWCK